MTTPSKKPVRGKAIKGYIHREYLRVGLQMAEAAAVYHRKPTRFFVPVLITPLPKKKRK